MREWETDTYETMRHLRYRKIRNRFQEIVTTGFECETGWYGILETYFYAVDRLLKAHPGSYYKLSQVKEKFAGLRIYVQMSADISAAEAEINEWAEKRAARTCEVCGHPGVLRKRGGWYLTRCDTHSEGGVPVPPTED
jgi:hypothetical protein